MTDEQTKRALDLLIEVTGFIIGGCSMIFFIYGDMPTATFLMAMAVWVKK